MDLKFGHLVASSNDNFCNLHNIYCLAKTDEKSNNTAKFICDLWCTDQARLRRSVLKSCTWPRILKCLKLIVSVSRKGPSGSHSLIPSSRLAPSVRPWWGSPSPSPGSDETRTGLEPSLRNCSDWKVGGLLECPATASKCIGEHR